MNDEPLTTGRSIIELIIAIAVPIVLGGFGREYAKRLNTLGKLEHVDFEKLKEIIDWYFPEGEAA